MEKALKIEEYREMREQAKTLKEVLRCLERENR